mgnify:CR=1 FL=1
MAKTKKEIEEWLKVFYRRQKERQIEDDVWEEGRGSEEYEFFVRSCYENNFTIYIPEAIYDLLPDWDWDWEGCDWVMDSNSGLGLLGVEGEEYADEDAKEQYGVDSVDDLNTCIYKRFYCLRSSEYDWWVSLEEEIKGKTGLPFEEVVIEEGECFDEEDDTELELKNLKNQLKGEKANVERIKEEISKTEEYLISAKEALIENKEEKIVYLEDAIKKLEG